MFLYFKIYMISRIHFDEQDDDQFMLYNVMNFWTQKEISKFKFNFYALKQLVFHNFQIRVCALLWHHFAQLRLVQEFQNITWMLITQNVKSFLQLLNNIINSYDNKTRSISDMKLWNHILFLQHMQIYLLLKYVIKRADIDLLRRAIDRCCVYFHDSTQHKYAYEMLYLHRLVSTSAISSKLQRAILTNELINSRRLIWDRSTREASQWHSQEVI